MSHLISPHLTEAPDSDCCWLLELLGCNMWLLQHTEAQRRFCLAASFPHLVVDGEESPDVEVTLNHAVRPAMAKLVHYCLSLRAEGYKCPHQESDY